MKNIKLTLLGVVTLLFALTLNFHHALNDYGVLNNKLHVEVLAQSNSSGGGNSTTIGGIANPWLWKQVRTETKCIAYTSTGSSSSAGGSISFIVPGTPVGGSIGGGTTVFNGSGYTYEGYVYECYDGWSKLTCSRVCKA